MIFRSQWPRGLRRRSAAARLLRSWVRIPPGHGCLSVVSVVNWSLRRADHPSRGVLPTVVCRRVWSRNLVNEETIAHGGGGGAVAPKKKWLSAFGAAYLFSLFVKCRYGREEHAEFAFRINLRLSPLGKNEDLLHLHSTTVTVTSCPALRTNRMPASSARKSVLIVDAAFSPRNVGHHLSNKQY